MKQIALILLIILLAACSPSTTSVEMAATTVAQQALTLVAKTSAVSPTPSPTTTPETPTATPTPKPLSEQELQAVVDSVNKRIAPINISLVGGPATNYFYLTKDNKHLTENMVLLPTGEFQITLADGEQWNFSADDVAAVRPFKSENIVLHAAVWEIDQKTGNITWIPKEEILDWPRAMALKSTEIDIAIDWRLHELPDSYLDTQFSGTNPNIKWSLIDIPKFNIAQALVTHNFNNLSIGDISVTYDELPLRPFPYWYVLTDFPDTGVYFTIIKQPAESTMVVNNVAVSTTYATFLSAVDKGLIDTSNPYFSFITTIDSNSKEDLGVTTSVTNIKGEPVYIVPAPVVYNPSSDTVTDSSVITSVLPIFQYDPNSIQQIERANVLSDGVKTGIFNGSYKYLWPMLVGFSVAPTNLANATPHPRVEIPAGTFVIQFGQAQSGKNGPDLYAFSGTTGQKISIIMNKTAGGASFPSLTLSDDAGNILKSDVACCQSAAQPKSWWETQAVILDFELPYTGTYFIKAAMIQNPGAYSLQVNLSQ